MNVFTIINNQISNDPKLDYKSFQTDICIAKFVLVVAQIKAILEYKAYSRNSKTLFLYQTKISLCVFKKR